MERGAVIVAGFGFRSSAQVESLQDALAQSGYGDDVTLLATVQDKAKAFAFESLAKTLGLPVVPVPQGALSDIETETQSSVVQAHRHTGSVAEAAAIVAAGPGAELLQTRVMSTDRLATCAIARAASKGVRS